MLDLQEISDRLEIQQLFADYADALDHRDFDRLDDVITEDAYLDYRSVGGIHGQYPEIKVWLSERVPLLGDYFHMVGNFSATFENDTATTRIACFHPVVSDPSGDGSRVVLHGFWYHDRLVRTPDGWRIRERILERCFDTRTAPRPEP